MVLWFKPGPSLIQLIKDIAVSNGTAALHLALKALGIGPGDEIIVPSLTFIATANVVAYCGAKPVFVDVHPEYWCLDPTKLEEKINDRTKAIIPVHLYGHPCDMDPILEIAEKRGIAVVEDCAEAPGAKYKGRKVGSFGDISCFSFFGNKIITTGEGGMCITKDDKLAEKMRKLRDHGKVTGSEYRHDVVGFNYRMTNLQAAIGVAQLEKIDSIMEARNGIVAHYNTLLKGPATLPPHMPWADPVCWLYATLLPKRDDVMETLKKEDIETKPFFLPIHQQPIYESNQTLPVSESLSQKGLNLPTYVGLGDAERKRISEVILAVLSG